MTDKPDPFKNFTPRQNPVKPQMPVDAANSLTQSDMEKLEGLTREELIALVRRCNGVHVALMTKAEVAEAMMHQIALRALEPGGREVLAACQQWLDREKGKAVTPIAAQVVVKDEAPVDKRELARRVQFLLAMAENDGESTPTAIL